MDRKFIVIENDYEKHFLLPWKEYLANGIPKGYHKRTRTIPLPENYWEEVKDLPVYMSNNSGHCPVCGPTVYKNVEGKPICEKCGRTVTEEEIAADIKARFEELKNG